MIYDHNYGTLIRSMDWVFDVQERSYECTKYFEFFERYLQMLSPSAKDYA